MHKVVNTHSHAMSLKLMDLAAWGVVRREVAAGAELGAPPSLGWTGNIANSRSPTPKMDFMDVAFQMIGTAKK